MRPRAQMHWMRPLALLTAWVMSLTQAAPPACAALADADGAAGRAASAYDMLRGSAVDATAGVERGVGLDLVRKGGLPAEWKS